MKWLYVLILIGGLGYIVFQLLLSSGGRTKFKSDLPKTEVVKAKKKVGTLICFLSLCLIILVLLIALIRSFL